MVGINKVTICCITKNNKVNFKAIRSLQRFGEKAE